MSDLRVRYDRESDILMVVVRQDAPVDAVEEPGGVIVSYGADGEPVSVEFLQASRRQMVPDGILRVTLDGEGGEGAVESS